jgi:hypothetical protein
LPDAAYSYDGEARDAAVTLLEGHPDVLSYARVFPAAQGSERYAVVLSNGKRYTVEVALVVEEEAA